MFFALHANAQYIRAGLTAGISTSQVSGDNLSGFNKAGIIGGGCATAKISNMFSGQFEILFIQKGSRKNINPQKNDYTQYKMNLNYIEVPLLLKYHYNKKLIFETGPSFGTLMSFKEEDENGEIGGERPFYKTELAVNLGLNYVISPGFLFNCRWSNSILPIREHTSRVTYRLNRGQLNTVLSFSLKYIFNAQEK